MTSILDVESVGLFVSLAIGGGVVWGVVADLAGAVYRAYFSFGDAV